MVALAQEGYGAISTALEAAWSLQGLCVLCQRTASGVVDIDVVKQSSGVLGLLFF